MDLDPRPPSSAQQSRCRPHFPARRYTTITAALMCIGYGAAHAAGVTGHAEADIQGADLSPTIPTLPVVTVTADNPAPDENGVTRGYAAEKSRMGSKTQTAILEIPQSVSVVGRQQMEVQQPLSTSQALRYTSGATGEKYGGFGSHLDLTKIRGIDADYYLDGLRIIGNTGSWTPQIDPYTLERVEVLRGPSSSVYGQGTGGGIVNQVSRKPQDVASHEVSVQVGNFRRKQIGIDTTGPLNDEKTLSYRLTATGLDTNAQIEDVRHRRLYLAPSLTWRPGSQTSWTIMATHVREPDIGNYNSLPAAALGLGNSPYPQVNRNRNYTDTNFADSSRSQDSFSSLFEHKFSNGWRFTSNLRYMYINAPLQRSAVYGYVDVAGKMLLKGTYEQAPGSSNTLSMDNHVSGDIVLGAARHTVLLGIDYARGTVRNAYYSDGPVLFDPYGASYRPAIHPDFTASHTRSPYNVIQQFERIGMYAQDQMAYGHWRLTLSARHDRSQTDDQTQSYAPAIKYTRQDDRKWSSRAGLSYQFAEGIAPYISHATSFDPLLGSDYKGTAFVPVETKQSEIGIKYHPANSSTQVSAALFQLNQTNVKTSDADHLGFNNQAGEVRTRGADFQATAEILRNLNLIASHTYLDNALIKDARYQGKSLVQTPKHSASAWLDYLIGSGPLRGLHAGIGVRYLGDTWGDPSNTFKVPGVTLTDLALHYDLGVLSAQLRGATFALNVSNLTDKRYVASCTSRLYCFIGQDRTAVATLGYRW